MKISAAALNVIRRHAAETSPEECCGLLIGRLEDGTSVLEAVPMANVFSENRNRRYRISPDALFRATRDAERRELDVVGFYHSHPDHPALPSETDLAEATFPNYVYLIQSVRSGEPTEITAWRLSDDRSRFVGEIISEDRQQSKLNQVEK